jgi:hypothetical protein
MLRDHEHKKTLWKTIEDRLRILSASIQLQLKDGYAVTKPSERFA